MKLKEKNITRKLRKQGSPLNKIREKTGIAKSSISIWVRNIKLTFAQKQKLTKSGIRKSVIEKRRITRLTNENTRRELIIDEAKKNIKHLSKREL